MMLLKSAVPTSLDTICPVWFEMDWWRGASVQYRTRSSPEMAYYMTFFYSLSFLLISENTCYQNIKFEVDQISSFSCQTLSAYQPWLIDNKDLDNQGPLHLLDYQQGSQWVVSISSHQPCLTQIPNSCQYHAVIELLSQVSQVWAS